MNSWSLFLQYKSYAISYFSLNFLSNFSNGTFKPVIDTVLPFSEIRTAHEMMESNKINGKIVLQVRDSDDVREELWPLWILRALTLQ